ncbi:MAG: hypothetical protein DKM50_09535 [Candidatus Margulisiibacteriota bacterium]|nr:MAG: hypothetical protein A2X43_05040 [Candidatus Margulisbacteria bacterium GWD2_39_127]OGI02365.1 MAG: hypothetical protein A2X42_09430 [Candidatus Margulisbacteria bacterium GWF2_38_17]PZM79010.1 MAG: hypothetical protein DKM50_09535 [Candidatus Margulisiibacteriota bacterium]HAR64211.1 hypothetical protein [Candidatus Margulisiibacteriota bacterium]HCY36115.1 hypothetical protein [Candidatus Margulisiibacteriota bacterium]
MEEKKNIKSSGYYRNKKIRDRMVEFLGGTTLSTSSAVYITRCDIPASDQYEKRPPVDLDFYLNNGLDICRSLWDRDSLIIDLDIEYVNYDFPAEAYLDPIRTFSLQHPVHNAVEEILLQYNIIALNLLSGRGHHFTWRIKKKSQAFDLLKNIGRVSQDLLNYYKSNRGPEGEEVDVSLGKAFSGIALVMEYVAHLIKRKAGPLSKLPLELAAVEVTPQERGREMISIDITEYGDPLTTRMIRLPFSVYLKPWYKYGILNESTRGNMPFIFMIPRNNLEINHAIRIMRDEKKAASLAITSAVRIPDQSDFMSALIAEYQQSDLADFHTRFYSLEHHHPETWPNTYDRLSMKDLPPCIQYILMHPNDLLQKPGGIRLVVRSLLALDWHPRHIAGLIRSKYERDYGWGHHWYTYDASLRADFYVRVFAGQIEVGLDNLNDFNCTSTKGMHYCFDNNQSCTLDTLRANLLKRKKS